MPINRNVIGALNRALSSGFVQRIENVAVLPHPQTVNAWFTTTQPTVPIVSVLNERLDPRDTEQVYDVKFHLFTPPATEHAYLLGEGEHRLRQGTRHQLKIVAAATAFPTANPTAPTRVVRFSTLRRQATVRVNHIYVHSSGDGTSPGDMTFAIAVYDGERRTLVAPAYSRGSSPVENRSVVQINHTFTIDNAPDSLVVYVFTLDDDSSDFPYPGAGFDLPGTGAPVMLDPDKTGDTYERSAWAGAFITRLVNLPKDTIDAWTQSFTMNPPVGVVNFLVDFTVQARVWTPYEDSIPGVKKVKKLARVPSVAAGIGDVGGVFTRGGYAHQLAIGPENTVIVRQEPPPGPITRLDAWTSLGTTWGSPVTIATDAAGGVHALTVDDAGMVRHRSWREDALPDAEQEWRSLGGAACGPVLSVRAGDDLHLFARGQDGAVHHLRGLQDASRNRRAAWTNLGKPRGQSLLAVGSEASGAHLFAYDEAGRVQHKSFDGRAWSPARSAWRDLGDGGSTALFASAGDDGGVGLVTILDDASARWKEWSRGEWFPEGRRWETAASVHELFDEEVAEGDPTSS